MAAPFIGCGGDFVVVVLSGAFAVVDDWLVVLTVEKLEDRSLVIELDREVVLFPEIEVIGVELFQIKRSEDPRLISVSDMVRSE